MIRMILCTLVGAPGIMDSVCVCVCVTQESVIQWDEALGSIRTVLEMWLEVQVRRHTHMHVHTHGTKTNSAFVLSADAMLHSQEPPYIFMCVCVCVHYTGTLGSPRTLVRSLRPQLFTALRGQTFHGRYTRVA